MAMLAGPRRKQKVINLRAKNSEWSKDTNKFGQRMLEKMGWSSGKGLGAKENGMVEHVVARFKNDEKGLGFEDKNDQWTKHEDDFNTLLSNLSNGDSNEEKLHSGVSLEVKSKKSKARVHYHKFTRGKDLTRYSEKDLANIFGKKSLKNEIPAEKLVSEEFLSTEQVFTEKGSMEDYFKNKLAAIQSKSDISSSFSNIKENYEADFSFQGFSGTKNEDAGVQVGGLETHSFYNKIGEQLNEIVEEVSIKKTKKSKKSKKDHEQFVGSDIEKTAPNHCDKDIEVIAPQKKKKSKKNKQENETVPEVIEKLKRKISKIEIPSTKEVDEIKEEDYHIPKKKKKRKNKDKEC